MRLKENKSSQNSPQVIKKAVEEDIEEEEEVEEDIEEEEVEEPIKIEKKPIKIEKVAPKIDENIEEKSENVGQIEMEMELLQNDGRFRVELLHRYNEISQWLQVIAGVLVESFGKEK
jgi:hypothetical protein